MFRFQLVPPLPPGRLGDPGLMGPPATVWGVARERAILLGGPTALLLQIAHPLVAAGVDQGSSFHTDPAARLVKTLGASLVVTFGDLHQARAVKQAVARGHAPVKGSLAQTEGPWKQGTSYSAFQAELDLWVYVTLVEVALDVYSASVRPLSSYERAQYYEGSEPFGPMFGVTNAVRPPSYTALGRYYQDMIENRLVVGPTARKIAKSIFEARLWGIPVSPAAQILAARFLPSKLAAAYGITPGWGYHASFQVIQWIARTAIPHTPDRIRFWPHYHTAVERIMQPSVEPHAP
jgi:uncharacterized protein (DUF2236 family)